jgi:hypothetical protein
MKKLLLLTAVVVIIALNFSGCVTPPDIGFPLIDIVDAEVDVANDSRFADAEEAQWTRSANTRIIGGTVGSKIVPKDLTITLIDTSIQRPIKNGADVTGWFLNIPKGLKATAHAPDKEARFAADVNATEITVTIEGTPEEAINQPIKIQVPYEVTNRSWDFRVPVNQDRRFEVYGVAAYNDGDPTKALVVGGAVSRKIDDKTFSIRFGGTKLAELLAQDTDISSWFTNLPRGLKAVVAEETVPVTEGQQSLAVTISGTPTIQLSERIHIEIPADITESKMALKIPPSDNAVYDIGPYKAEQANDVELRTGTNWKGTIEGWGLTGPEVYRNKDFTAVGIIQISTESTHAIGQDGEYHWTGDTITYGDLMAEAKKLNAHAIIDVVIDSKDAINKTTETRHIEAGHVATALEQSKIDQGLIKIIREDPRDRNSKVIAYEESITVTRRTWIGTALAIQYAPAYEPTVGDGRSTGYIPSVPGLQFLRPDK